MIVAELYCIFVNLAYVMRHIDQRHNNNDLRQSEKGTENTVVMFEYKKAVQVINFFAAKHPRGICETKLLKLTFFADRLHLRRYGRLITNDIYLAMDRGPVPSGLRNLAQFNIAFGVTSEMVEHAKEFFTRNSEKRLKSINEVDTFVMSNSDMNVLNQIWEEYGEWKSNPLWKHTHNYPEWSKYAKSFKSPGGPRLVEMNIEDFLLNAPPQAKDICRLDNQDREAALDILRDDLAIQQLISGC